MRKYLKRRSVRRLNAIFKEGRLTFPSKDFSNLVFLGVLYGQKMFAAQGIEHVTLGNTNVVFDNEVSWGE